MRAAVDRITRAVWPVAVGLALGLAIGGAWSLLQSDRYLAKAHVTLTGGPANRLAPAVETLANGSVVEQNVKQTLRLSDPPDLSASVDKNIVEVRAEAGSAERARQVGAEAAQVLTQLVAARFGSQGLHATLLDPAHVVEQTSPTPERNLLICGLLGLVAGAGLVYAQRPRDGAAAPVGGGVMLDPNLEHRLKKRVDEVTKRERAMARRAGELAKREAELEQRRGQLDQLESRPTERDSELGATKEQLTERAGSIAAGERELAARAAAPPPPPEPEPAATPAAVAPSPAVTRVGSWNVNDLQRTVDSQSGATAEQAEEWRSYLYLLRAHAAVDGSLPPQFDGLVEDVFGKLTR